MQKMRKKKMPEIDLTDKGLKEIIREMLYYDIQIKLFRAREKAGLIN